MAARGQLRRHPAHLRQEGTQIHLQPVGQRDQAPLLAIGKRRGGGTECCFRNHRHATATTSQERARHPGCAGGRPAWAPAGMLASSPLAGLRQRTAGPCRSRQHDLWPSPARSRTARLAGIFLPVPNMPRLLPLSLLLLTAFGNADAAPTPITIEQAMADPDWIGPPVESAWWSWDGRQVQYTFKR